MFYHFMDNKDIPSPAGSDCKSAPAGELSYIAESNVNIIILIFHYCIICIDFVEWIFSIFTRVSRGRK